MTDINALKVQIATTLARTSTIALGRSIRTLVHAQPWYDGADIPIGPRDFVVHSSNIPTKAIYDDLAHLFNRVPIYFKKRSDR